MLTFYTERIANESYLRTATERVSLQELGELIGYRLRPRRRRRDARSRSRSSGRPTPPRAAARPGAFATGVPPRVTLPAGLRVQSVPGPGEKPQTFETVEAIEARPEWNALPVVRTDSRIRRSATEPTPGSPASACNLTPGDALLFAGTDLRQTTAGTSASLTDA